MNKQQKAKVNMFLAVILFFGKYIKVFTGYVRLIAEIDTLTAIVQDMDGDIGTQKTNTRGVTASKNNLVNAAVALVVKSSRKARVWADDIGKTDMEALFNIHVTDFLGLGDIVILDKLVIIKKAINDNLTSLVTFKVAAIDMTNIDAAIAAARAAIGTPSQASSTKVTSTVNIEEKIGNAMVSLSKVDDLLIPEYEGGENDEVVVEYRVNRQINPAGAHHTGILPTVRNVNNVVMEGVTCTISKLNRSAVSNIDGVAEIIKFKSGKYEIVFSMAGHADYTIIQDVPLGKIVEFDVVMKAS